MCGLGIEMCALGPILACTYRTGPYGGIGAYVYNQIQICPMPYGGIGAYVYNQVNNISKCALGLKMCGLGIEMCALGPILACTYSSRAYGGKGAYVYNQ